MKSPRKQGLALAVLAAAVLVASVAAGASSAAASSHKVVLYSVATAEQYVNNKDDRERGQGANPFGNFHDANPTTKQAKGPFPGDEALFQFSVYGTPGQTKTVGSGQYTCLFNFNHNVFCNAVYDLPGGTMVGSGAFDFDASSFNLAVTGGTGKYAGMRGNVEVVPAAHHGEQLTFTLG